MRAHAGAGQVDPEAELPGALPLERQGQAAHEARLEAEAAADVLELLAVPVHGVAEEGEARSQRAQPEVGLQEVVAPLEIPRAGQSKGRLADAVHGSERDALVPRQRSEIAVPPRVREPQGTRSGAPGEAEGVIVDVQVAARRILRAEASHAEGQALQRHDTGQAVVLAASLPVIPAHEQSAAALDGPRGGIEEAGRDAARGAGRVDQELDLARVIGECARPGGGRGVRGGRAAAGGQRHRQARREAGTRGTDGLRTGHGILPRGDSFGFRGTRPGLRVARPDCAPVSRPVAPGARAAQRASSGARSLAREAHGGKTRGRADSGGGNFQEAPGRRTRSGRIRSEMRGREVRALRPRGRRRSCSSWCRCRRCSGWRRARSLRPGSRPRAAPPAARRRGAAARPCRPRGDRRR